MHNDNKSNNVQMGQVVTMGGSEKPQDFFLCNEFHTHFQKTLLKVLNFFGETKHGFLGSWSNKFPTSKEIINFFEFGPSKFD
jgi:hypothetical protein